MTYLLANPPRRSQFRKTRRAKPTGTIVLHSAENAPDLRLPDEGAERIASFIRDRSDPGSYHVICDQDTRIQLVPFAYEAFHDGTNSNPWSIGLSLALRASDWPKLTDQQRLWYMASLATAARDASDWLHAHYSISVPTRRLTEASPSQPGFCSHQDRENWFGSPGRRTDPWGNDEVMWHLFLTLYEDTRRPTSREDRPDMHGTEVIAAYGEAGYLLATLHPDKLAQHWRDIRAWTHDIYSKPTSKERDDGVLYLRAVLGLK